MDPADTFSASHASLLRGEEGSCRGSGYGLRSCFLIDLLEREGGMRGREEGRSVRVWL
jgi:hypothetical protein